MDRLFRYYTQFQSLQGTLTGLPPWAIAILTIAAIPGILLLALSMLGVLVSILALLLLTVPVYRLLRAVTSGNRPHDQAVVANPGVFVSRDVAGHPHVDVKIIDQAP